MKKDHTHSEFSYKDDKGKDRKTDIPRWSVRATFLCRGLIGDISVQLAENRSQSETAQTMLDIIDKTLTTDGKTFDDIPGATADTITELFNHILKVEGFISDEKEEPKN